jgi:hypothetical protein
MENTLSFESIFAKVFSLPILVTGIKTGIFEILTDNDYNSTQQIKAKLNLLVTERNLLDFLDKLYHEGYLQREIKNDTFYYKNTEAANKLFTNASNDNIINNILRFEHLLYEFKELPNVLKEGKRTHLKQEFFQTVYADEDKLYNFQRSMLGLQRNNFNTLVNKFDFSKYNTLVDIGGGLGLLSCMVKKQYPTIKCINYDLECVSKHCRQYLKENEMEGSVELINGDMFKDEFPRGDLIAMGNILHDWNYEKKRYLLKKVYDSLDDCGACIIVEDFIDNGRASGDKALGMSILMLLDYGDAYNMTNKEIVEMAQDVGFKKVEFVDEKCIAICYK